MTATPYYHRFFTACDAHQDIGVKVAEAQASNHRPSISWASDMIDTIVGGYSRIRGIDRCEDCRAATHAAMLTYATAQAKRKPPATVRGKWWFEMAEYDRYHKPIAWDERWDKRLREYLAAANSGTPELCAHGCGRRARNDGVCFTCLNTVGSRVMAFA